MSSGELNSNHILCSPCFSQGDSGLQGDKGEKVCAFERRNELALARSLTHSPSPVYFCAFVNDVTYEGQIEKDSFVTRALAEC